MAGDPFLKKKTCFTLIFLKKAIFSSWQHFKKSRSICFFLGGCFWHDFWNTHPFFHFQNCHLGTWTCKCTDNERRKYSFSKWFILLQFTSCLSSNMAQKGAYSAVPAYLQRVFSYYLSSDRRLGSSRVKTQRLSRTVNSRDWLGLSLLSDSPPLLVLPFCVASFKGQVLAAVVKQKTANSPKFDSLPSPTLHHCGSLLTGALFTM